MMSSPDLVDWNNNRRRFPRVKAPVYYRPARFRTTRIPVVDIGAGGVRIYSDEPLKVGERLSIELFLPNEMTLGCLVRVAWLSELPSDAPAKYDVGLQILDADPVGLQFLTKLVEEESS